MILFFILLPQIFCQILKELKKYSSMKVIPETKIYLDISSFKDGATISLEFTMDLFFASDQEREEYTFNLEQVSFTSHPSATYWDTMREVTAKDKEIHSDDYTFKWDEIKQPGSTYIYIKTPAPFSDYYSYWGYKIKVKNAGGVNALPIVLGIVIPLIVIIIIIIIVCVVKKRSQYNLYRFQQISPQPVIIQQNRSHLVYPQQKYIVYQVLVLT